MEHLNALDAGTRLEEYEIRTVLGQGGFGITYLALDTSLNIDVALCGGICPRLTFQAVRH